ncbi:hypothetical protein MRS44_010749 [Fusarium solani]|uniref:uncharacterized protein n=1 Tax=Fusarium solani TaxID=169388 RepID=UPI0032C47C2F|nr:hypothetical protein MRS44_010749 [Fusarium solani]
MSVMLRTPHPPDSSAPSLADRPSDPKISWSISQDKHRRPDTTVSAARRDVPPDERRPDAGYGSFPTTDRDIPKPAKQSTRALAPDLLRGLLMLTMALDHMALALNTWQHGTGRETEMDGVVIKEWNRPVAYVVRTLTHLCASGFTMLLGVGVVYLGRSRTRLGWSSLRIAKYFAVRTAVLTLIGVLLGLAVSGGRVWFMNFVLFSLAIDYFLAGMLWLVIDTTEPLLARAVTRMFPDKVSEEDEVDEPLLRRDRAQDGSEFGVLVSWHVHNFLLAVLGLGPRIRRDAATLCGCERRTRRPRRVSQSPAWHLVLDHADGARHVCLSPMAWVSFAVLGLLYGRIDVTRTWSSGIAALCNLVAGLGFLVLFVLTRVLRFGNLSEGCLQTPEHDKYPDRNPYLASAQSFFYIIKYPPDVAFWAFTLAGNFFLLAFFGGIPTSVAKRFTLLLDFGRAALFFYITHLFFIFILGPIMVALFGHDTGIPTQMDPGSTRGIDNAFAYFGIWAFAMLVMWPAVRWYGSFKGSKPADSIWRFF